MQDQSLERDALHQLLNSVVKEQRANRRWKIFFRLTFLVLFLLLLLLLFSDGNTASNREHTALVSLQGMIRDDTATSAKNVTQDLQAAFDNKHSKAIMLYINSGGGSPVQSSIIYNEIMTLRKKHPNKKIYAICADVCASGAYFIAAATDEIYANQSSIVGSIGVLMNGFGFVDSLKKLGMERRLLTAGTEKASLDPFSPEKPEAVAHAKHMLNVVHQQFINAVKDGRGNRLKDDPDLFSGLFWSGEEAFSLGLIDGFGDTYYVAREITKQTNVVDYTHSSDVLQRLAKNIGSTTTSQIANYFGIQPQGLF